MWEILNKPISIINLNLPLWAIISIVSTSIVVAVVTIIGSIGISRNAKEAKNAALTKLSKQDKIVSDFESKNGIYSHHEIPQSPTASEISSLPNPEAFMSDLKNDEIVNLDKNAKLDNAIIERAKSKKAYNASDSAKVKAKKQKVFQSDMPTKYSDDLDKTVVSSFSKSQIEEFKRQVDGEDDGKLVDTYFDDKHIKKTSQNLAPTSNTFSSSDEFDDFDDVTPDSIINSSENITTSDNQEISSNSDNVVADDENTVEMNNVDAENAALTRASADDDFNTDIPSTSNASNDFDDLFEVLDTNFDSKINGNFVVASTDTTIVDDNSSLVDDNITHPESKTSSFGSAQNEFSEQDAIQSLFGDCDEDKQEIDSATQEVAVAENDTALEEEVVAPQVDDEPIQDIAVAENDTASDTNLEEQAVAPQVDDEPVQNIAVAESNTALEEEVVAPQVDDEPIQDIAVAENDTASDTNLEDQAVAPQVDDEPVQDIVVAESNTALEEQAVAPQVDDEPVQDIVVAENDTASDTALEEQAVDPQVDDEPVQDIAVAENDTASDTNLEEQAVAPQVDDEPVQDIVVAENDTALEEQAVAPQVVAHEETIAPSAVQPVENEEVVAPQVVAHEETIAPIIAPISVQPIAVKEIVTPHVVEEEVAPQVVAHEKIVAPIAKNESHSHVVESPAIEDFDEENPLEDLDDFDDFDFDDTQSSPQQLNQQKQYYPNYTSPQSEKQGYQQSPQQYSMPNKAADYRNNQAYVPPTNAPFGYVPPIGEQQYSNNYNNPNYSNSAYGNNYPPNSQAKPMGADNARQQYNPYAQMPPTFAEYTANGNGYYANSPYLQSTDSGYKQGTFKMNSDGSYPQNDNVDQGYNASYNLQYPNEYLGNDNYPSQAQSYYRQPSASNFNGYNQTYSQPSSPNNYASAPQGNQYGLPQQPQNQPVYNDAYQYPNQPINAQQAPYTQPQYEQRRDQQSVVTKQNTQPRQPAMPQQTNIAVASSFAKPITKPAVKAPNYTLRQPVVKNPNLVVIIPLTDSAIDEKRGRFRIIMDAKNTIRPYKFQLITKNNQVLFESQSFKVKPRAPQIDAFRKVITTGAFEFNQEPNGAFRYNLLTANERLCGVGDMYKNMESAEKSALATKKYGLAANYIEDITNAQKEV